MIRRNERGQLVRVFSYTGPMRKHGGDRQMRQDAAIAALEAISKTRVVYTATVRIRKAGAK